MIATTAATSGGRPKRRSRRAGAAGGKKKTAAAVVVVATAAATTAKPSKAGAAGGKKKAAPAAAKPSVKSRSSSAKKSPSGRAQRRSSSSPKTAAAKRQPRQPKGKRRRGAQPAPATPQASRHTAAATKQEAENLRRQLVQYMDTSGYVSWSAKSRKYMILGTSEDDAGLVPCPNCGVGRLLVIKSPKSGKRFMGCTNFYGGCDASSPLLQRARLRATKKPCGSCGWPEVIFRYSSKQKWTRQCSNIACTTRSQARSEG